MKSNIATLLVVLLAAMLVASVAFADKKSGKTDAAAEITRLEQESVKADLANDSSFAKKYQSDDYTAGSSWGNWETKDSILKDMSDTKNNKMTSEDMQDLKVRSYGNTAIATY